MSRHFWLFGSVHYFSITFITPAPAYPVLREREGERERDGEREGERERGRERERERERERGGG